MKINSHQLQFSLYDPKSLHHKTIRYLYRLSLRDGTIRDDLRGVLNSKYEGYVIICKLNTKIIGWSLIYRSNKNHRFNVSVYVQNGYRFNGIGRNLVLKRR